jgi:hypothetical protein
MLETKPQILDPQRWLETNLFVATEGPLAVSGLRWRVYRIERDSHPLRRVM